jgi:hypothetical protein
MNHWAIRSLSALGALVAASALAVPQAGASPADQPFTSSVFLATHNSYSGNLDGAKDSIPYQLDHGARFIELDVQDNDYATNHDYSIGHNSAGDAVDHAGNPASNLLRDWLDMIASWSSANPTHAPLVVMLDLKDDLTDNGSFAGGDLAALNQELKTAFGSALLPASSYQTGATVDSLRGRVLTLLSGDAGTRTEYKADTGADPAVALNGHGQIVEVYDSGAGALWYWTGTYGADGRVTWLRHGKYDSGTTPAVALDNNGDLVETHQSQTASTLWYHVGHLGSDGEITFSASHQYDSGVQPSLEFTSLAGTTLHEIHRSPSGSQDWTWTGTLNPAAGTVAWTGNAKTSAAPYPRSTATSGTERVTVYTGADGATPAGTLRVSTDRVTGDLVRYPQVAFDEYQDGDSAELQQGALFYAAPATDSAFITAARQSGHLVRGWDFDSAGLVTTPLANYPASNTPYAAWYQTMITNAGAVR